MTSYFHCQRCDQRFLEGTPHDCSVPPTSRKGGASIWHERARQRMIEDRLEAIEDQNRDIIAILDRLAERYL